MYKIGDKVIANIRNLWINEAIPYNAEVIEVFPTGTFVDTEREVFVNNDQVGILTHQNCPLIIREPFSADENYYYVKVGERIPTNPSEAEVALANAISEILTDLDLSALTTGRVVCKGYDIELVPESAIEG